MTVEFIELLEKSFFDHMKEEECTKPTKEIYQKCISHLSEKYGQENSGDFPFIIQHMFARKIA